MQCLGIYLQLPPHPPTAGAATLMLGLLPAHLPEWYLRSIQSCSTQSVPRSVELHSLMQQASVDAKRKRVLVRQRYVCVDAQQEEKRSALWEECNSTQAIIDWWWW